MRHGTGLAFLFSTALLASSWAACGGTGNSGTNGTSTNGTGGSGASGQSSSTGDGGGFTFDAGQGDGQSGCDPQTFTLLQAPPAEVYLVIDRSGSMLEPGSQPGLTRWDEVKAAIDAAVTQFEKSIEFGLLMYPDGSECGTSGPQVKFEKDNRNAIYAALNAKGPAGGTPTAAALNNAAASLLSLGKAGSPKLVILATDGGPNCNYFLDAKNGCSCTYAQPADCCTNTPNACYFGSSCLDDAESIATIDDLKAQGIDTYVIGLSGTSQYASLLNAMAQAGGHPQVGGQTDYYVASDQAQFLAALQTIAVSVISCTIDLGSKPDDPDKVSVFVDGQLVPQDKTKMAGWDYTDGGMTQIELHGAFCDTLQDGKEHNLTATFECVVK